MTTYEKSNNSRHHGLAKKLCLRYQKASGCSWSRPQVLTGWPGAVAAVVPARLWAVWPAVVVVPARLKAALVAVMYSTLRSSWWGRRTCCCCCCLGWDRPTGCCSCCCCCQRRRRCSWPPSWAWCWQSSSCCCCWLQPVGQMRQNFLQGVHKIIIIFLSSKISMYEKNDHL